MDWLKRQYHRAKTGICVVIFFVGLVFFILGFLATTFGEWVMGKAIVHCPDMVCKYGR